MRHIICTKEKRREWSRWRSGVEDARNGSWEVEGEGDSDDGAILGVKGRKASHEGEQKEDTIVRRGDGAKRDITRGSTREEQ